MRVPLFIKSSKIFPLVHAMKYCFQLDVSSLSILLYTLTATALENETTASDEIQLYHGNETVDEKLDLYLPPIFDPDLFLNESCPETNCSEYSANTTIDDRVTERSCNCDEKCAVYRDCCADSQYYDSEEERKPNPYEYRSYDRFRFLVKGTCPLSWKDQRIREKCAASADYTNLNIEHVELRIPVTSLRTAIVYGNVYCAVCHGENYVKPWTVKIKYTCPRGFHGLDIGPSTCKDRENVTINNLQFDGNRWSFRYNDLVQYCTLKTYPPNDTMSDYRWKTFVISSCPANWTDLSMKEKCGDAYLRVADKTNGNVYRNKYCAYCNGANESDLGCPHPIVEFESSMSSSRSFSVLFDYKFVMPSELCQQNQTSSTDQICLIEETTTSESENWFFNAYTSIAISVSLLFLIVHLIVYSFVKELHTIGGQSMASYCVALMLAYGAFLLGNFVTGLACTVVAILMYYFFLCAFTWMLTISYDLWRTFWNATKHLRSPSHPNKKFLLYSLWSWSAPLVPVSTALYLHYSHSDSNLAPRFGERDDSCWFQNGYSLLVFFVVPVSLAILLNFALFLHTSIMVHSSRCRSVNQKSRVDFKLFARIALLTGITWITGFVGGYTQMTAIWFIFIVLNTAQGVLIFIAFSCKKRIIYSFLKRLGVCESWQETLNSSISKTTDTKSSTLTSNVDRKT